MDDDLQQALELSAKAHVASCTSLVLEGERRMERHELGSPNAQHWSAGLWAPQDGALLQVETLNQFAQHWLPLMEEYRTPTATCGYMAMAHAVLISRIMPQEAIWSPSRLDEVLRKLRDVQFVEPCVREAMAFVAKSRESWMDSHRVDFPTEDSRRKYSTAWVANYEISDFLQEQHQKGADMSGVFFARANQWPERCIATHEELVRLSEEERFGGNPASGNEGKVFRDGDSAFIVESFAPQRSLQTPEEFRSEWGTRGASAPTIFVADLQGHYVTCVAASLQSAVDQVAEKAVIVVNTTGGKYLDNPTCVFLFDLLHQPRKVDAVDMVGSACRHPAHQHDLVPMASMRHTCDVCGAKGTAYRCSRGCDWDLCERCLAGGAGPRPAPNPAALDQLVSMGFPQDRAREALERSGGSAARATDFLLSS